jgi:DNA-binding LacI/PurR family transcriptional regulator
MVTIADVAAHAGVGAGTVSRVLNNSPQVSATTRARVQASIAVLEYHPNPLARGLSRGRCQTVGVVVPFFTHASAIERLRGVVAALDGSRYDLVLFNVESPVHRDEHFAALARRDRADGLLVLSMPPPPEQLERLTRTVPVVLVDTRGDGVPMVVTDDVDGGRIATRHLVALGHQRIAFMGDDPENPFGFESSPDRERGYMEVLEEAGIDFDPRLVRHGPHDRVVGRRLTEQFLSLRDPPTAVFASSDVQALGVLEAARAAGLRVPDDLSVVGFDDIEVSAYAGITTVRQPLFDSGRLGAQLLLNALRHEDPPSPVTHELSLELVVRSTTAPRARRRGRR